MRKVLFAGLLALLLGGCATVVVDTPSGKEVKLAEEGTMLPTVAKKKVWYALWGLIPITNNSTADMVASCNQEVRVKRYIGVDDAIIGLFTMIVTIRPITVEVQCK